MTSLLPLALHPVLAIVSVDDQSLTGKKKAQQLSRQARLALARSCRISGYRLDRQPKNEHGAPQPVEGVHWSVTHKAGVVGAIAAPMPVGIDVETLRPVNPSMSNKVAKDKEWGRLNGAFPNTFFRLWTAKEAVLKAVGRGIAELLRCEIVEVHSDTRMDLVYEGTLWHVVHFWFADHLAALTSYDCRIDWEVVRGVQGGSESAFFPW